MRHALLGIVCGMGLLIASAAGAATILVTSTADSGMGTLRQAIIESNMSVGVLDVIEFDINGPPFTIQPTSALPTITDPVVIDGFSQDGAVPNTISFGAINAQPLIEINGALAGDADGLAIAHTASAIGTTVRGLVINGFNSISRAGIRMSNTGNHLIEGNFLGTDVTGLLARPNQVGVAVTAGGADGVTIGGILPATRNLISGNTQHGIALQTADNIVLGNLIGTDRTGVEALGNGIGVLLLPGSSNNQIGDIGLIFSPRTNVISGNLSGGVLIQGGATMHAILGNRIGVGADGLSALGNGSEAGVTILGSDNRVAENEIGGNSVGVAISDGTGNLIQANLIGVPSGNMGAGILVTDSSGNTIGGDIPNGNVISGNGGPGVQIVAAMLSANQNSILTNSMFDNDSFGIELVNGANNGQQPPILESATGMINNHVLGSLVGLPLSGYTLQFFASRRCDPSGFGEGDQFLGNVPVVTDGGGIAAINVMLPAGDERPYITATATDADGNTSQFSNCVLNREQVVAPAPTLGHVGLASALLLLIGIAGRGLWRGRATTV